ncbi:tRNA (N6-threonylcarbamoyladenosine(37)-N6)-methyltransferase TrmO [Vibrio lentus]|uniref:SAM-dependent methyltransferase n=1 Tax=Vibrio lentus TaxID=136468 RepID=UPI000C826B8B|nr:SAM-dependent methyltransferase [Vibrio lentus]PMI39206.1 tRNA (N6-threonylcarbamoyladenosine(37)-N6)-methyltransferase TrmO [Vibrio lentus]PMI63839.1 tRNA (N6-threonylcarbamoyladenosine(37)-N6)-methyltransferase TrmO [Vibrio lentus]PMJ50627.1 tRNA (N6-threonylcarbamoyladenosine(37)-N6)-methyltransferase TrmO [Vibrio lentus]PML47565.1 tRNA (N6-threonylcarbamoyladenosine(37)-N6)-methyltransferase TrmO [Vibrio lentus]PMN06874.1 tRNA (N6-threonylcarbamoyladenosine(37)-N6)-methyltransferase Trm
MSEELKLIGRITTPYHSISECPNNIQSDNGPICEIILDDVYQQGLLGLNRDDHILILYWLEGAKRDELIQSWNEETPTKGTFALRSPHRPNPIGAAVLPIEKIENDTVTVRGLDCLNNTPLLDIKLAIYKEKG